MELVISMETRPARGAEQGTPAAPSEAAVPWEVPEAVRRDPEGAPDGDLVRACVAGEGRFFEVLVRRYTGMVISFARSRLGSSELGCNRVAGGRYAKRGARARVYYCGAYYRSRFSDRYYRGTDTRGGDRF